MKKYMVICNGVSFIDSALKTDDLYEAKETCKEILQNWLFEETEQWERSEYGNLLPTPDQVDDFNVMINECGCWIVPFDESINDYTDDPDCYIYLTDDDLAKIGWDYY